MDSVAVLNTTGNIEVANANMDANRQRHVHVPLR